MRTVVDLALTVLDALEVSTNTAEDFFVKSYGDNQPMCSLCTEIIDSLVRVKEELSVDQQKFMTAVNQPNFWKIDITRLGSLSGIPTSCFQKTESKRYREQVT